MTEPRTASECDACGVTDTLPRHHVMVPTADGPAIVSRHIACCAENGCPDGSCPPQAAASD